MRRQDSLIYIFVIKDVSSLACIEFKSDNGLLIEYKYLCTCINEEFIDLETFLAKIQIDIILPRSACVLQYRSARISNWYDQRRI